MESLPYSCIFSLYIHIPFCVSRCDYCDFFSTVPAVEPRHGGGAQLPADVERSYIDALAIQLDALTRRFGVAQWRSIYIGGGTPGLLSVDAVSRIMIAVRRCAKLCSDAEITIEVNPEDCTKEWLFECCSCGINRVSVGIQSFDDTILNMVNRRTSAAANRKTLRFLADLSNSFSAGSADSVSFRWSADIIAGLPSQTRESFVAGIEELLSYHPRHVSLYTLSVEPETPLYRRLTHNGRTYAAVNCVNNHAESLWFTGCDIMRRHGLEQYEVSNFAYPGDESRHNKVYWTSQNWLGIGAGASGTVFYSDATALRITVPCDVSMWMHNPCASNEEYLNTVTCIKEFIMMGFRLKSGINGERFYQRFGCRFEDSISPVWNRWYEQKKADCVAGQFFLTDTGYLFLDDFISDCFDYLNNKTTLVL